MTQSGSLRPLRSAGFRYFLAARTVSLFGNAMAPVAIAFAVLQIGGSAGDLGLVLAARSIPLIVFMLYGGVVADRFPRHRVLVVSGLLSALVQSVAAGLLIGGAATVALLALIEAVHGAVSAFTMPAQQGIVPQVVPRDQLQQANALSAGGRNAAFIGGPALAGIVVATAGAGWAVAVDAATFAVSALLFARLRLPAAPVSTGSMVTELREGWSEFVSRTWVWLIVAAAGALNAVYACAWVTLGPVVAERTFGPQGWGIVLSLQAVGFMAGTVLMLYVRTRYPLRLGMVGALAIVLPLTALSLSPGVALLAAAAFVAGIGFDVFGVAWETALQQHIPIERLSRVSSYDMLGSFVAMPVGQVLAGPLTAVFEVRDVVLAAAGVYAVVALVTLAMPAVWNLRAEQSVPRLGASA